MTTLPATFVAKRTDNDRQILVPIQSIAYVEEGTLHPDTSKIVFLGGAPHVWIDKTILEVQGFINAYREAEIGGFVARR